MVFGSSLEQVKQVCRFCLFLLKKKHVIKRIWHSLSYNTQFYSTRPGNMLVSSPEARLLTYFLNSLNKIVYYMTTRDRSYIYHVTRYKSFILIFSTFTGNWIFPYIHNIRELYTPVYSTYTGIVNFPYIHSIREIVYSRIFKIYGNCIRPYIQHIRELLFFRILTIYGNLYIPVYS